MAGPQVMPEDPQGAGGCLLVAGVLTSGARAKPWPWLAAETLMTPQRRPGHRLGNVLRIQPGSPCFLLGDAHPVLVEPHGPAPSLNPTSLSSRPQITWFHVDCQDLMRQLRLGKTQRASPGDQRLLHRYLRRLASEFPAEKLTAMGLQVASLSQEGPGQALWEEARGRHEEIQTLLKRALAHCPCPAGPAAHSAHPELRKAAAEGRGLNAAVASRGRGRRGLPLRDSLGLDRPPNSYWPRAPREGQNGSFQAGLLAQEAGQAVEADEGKGPREPFDPASEPLLAPLVSWQ